MRDHVFSSLTDGELERARRELASLALSRPDSPIRTPIEARMTAIDALPSAPDARTANAMVRLCSCGFASDDYDWLICHLIDHPEHREMDSYWTLEQELHSNNDGERQR